MARKTTSRRRSTPSVTRRLTLRANEIVALLKRRKLSIATAESCTGGLIAAALSQADGASDVLEGGYVTYTKGQKHRALGIPAKLLNATGAVTADIARRMAMGAQQRAGAKIALSVTGVLGPKPDDDGNPVGLVYLCCVYGKRAHSQECRFPALSHDKLRCATVLAAFDLIKRTVRKRP